MAAKPKVIVSPVETVEKFVAQIKNNFAIVIVGIDPGRYGAIAFRCNQVYCVIDIPVFSSKVKRSRKSTAKQLVKTGKKSRTVLTDKRDFDHKSICVIFKTLHEVKDRVRVALEKIPPSVGSFVKYADIIINRAYAMWPLFLYSKGYPVYEPRPTQWKEYFKLGESDKEKSRRKALKLFPQADIKRKKDHNRAEALLIASYLWDSIVERQINLVQ